MADKLFTSIQSDALISGESGRISFSTSISATDGGSVGSTTVTAIGDGTVSTEVTSTSSVEQADGTVTGVEANAESTAAGEEATAFSSIESLLLSDDSLDLAAATATSGATGDETATADATVVPEGDFVRVKAFVPDLSFDVVAGEWGYATTSSDYGIGYDYGTDTV